jgi:hypothetical protein
MKYPCRLGCLWVNNQASLFGLCILMHHFGLFHLVRLWVRLHRCSLCFLQYQLILRCQDHLCILSSVGHHQTTQRKQPLENITLFCSDLTKNLDESVQITLSPGFPESPKGPLKPLSPTAPLRPLVPGIPSKPSIPRRPLSP